MTTKYIDYKPITFLTCFLLSLVLMINSYLKTALRSITRKKTFTILNIAGLATGIAATLIIFLVISYERSFDNYHAAAERIYRVTTNVSNRSNGEVTERLSNVNWEMPDKMKADFPAVDKAGLVSFQGGAQMYVPSPGKGEEKKFKQTGIFYTTPELYNILDYTWLSGNATGLSDPHTAVISEKTARAYFGDVQSAVGRTIQMWSYRVPFQIVGVFKDLPGNTDVPIEVGLSYNVLKTLIADQFQPGSPWEASVGYAQCFVLLKDKAQVANVTAGLPAFAGRYYKPSTTQLVQLQLQPLSAMHLDKRYHNFITGNLSSRELWALALIGSFLLIVACINFINLATALSVNRAKEIGVRKVLGSNRVQLFSQFLMETAVITLCAIAVAIVITIVALPYAGQLIDRDLPLTLLTSPATWAAILCCAMLVTLLSGFYPGMIVSGFNPVTALKSKISIKSTGGVSLRRGLVVFQFVIAQLLVIGTLVVVKQMNYVSHQSMGFNKDAVVMVNLPSDSTLKLKYNYLKTSLAGLPGVSAASFCFDAPTADWLLLQDFYFDSQPEKAPFKTGVKAGDADFFGTFDIKLKAGRLPYPSDTMREIVVNETMVKKLGLSSPEKIIGKTITTMEHKSYPIVGVINDFNSKSLHEAITPLFIGSQRDAYEYIALRLDPNKIPATLKKVEQTFTGIYPTYLYDLTFVDERVKGFYEADMITAKLFQLFAGIAVFISCLGLYGLISFMVTNRTREVGIRKVLGASVNNILFLFSKEFMLLIAIAFVIAAPLGYYFMQGWLSGFYYHTVIGAGIFVSAIVLSLLMAWVTVGYKALKAALSNPVKNLREN